MHVLRSKLSLKNKRAKLTFASLMNSATPKRERPCVSLNMTIRRAMAATEAAARLSRTIRRVAAEGRTGGPI